MILVLSALGTKGRGWLCRCGTRQCAVLPDRLLLPRAAFGQATDQRMAFGGWLKQWHKKRKALPAAGSVSCIYLLLPTATAYAYVLCAVYRVLHLPSFLVEQVPAAGPVHSTSTPGRGTYGAVIR